MLIYIPKSNTVIDKEQMMYKLKAESQANIPFCIV